ncbi:MAG TPA: hypothetical protein VGA66_06560 [Mycobacterium sp.]|jgi:hypothetical protein
MEIAEHPLAELVGLKTPGGTYRIAGYENWLLRDAVYAEPAEQAHPIAAFVGAQRGMGCTVAELFVLLGSDINDGPVLAESIIEHHSDLVTEVPYDVEGEVIGIVRKHGAALGLFDLVTVRFTLSPHAGDVVATVTNVYAIRRGEQ